MNGTARSAASGKGAGDENFPVASWLVAPRHRPAILAFYDFVRAADDVADHPVMPNSEKLRLLDQLGSTLLGDSEIEPAALALRAVLRERGMDPRHALDLLEAFRLDVSKRRYESWDELMGYCRLSAMPVGRYVLDLHGESPALWALNDPLCAALQIINHLQDCGRDFRDLDRVYLPLDKMREAGATVEELGAERASPALRRCLSDLGARTRVLLAEADAFASEIRDRRLSLEVAVIHRLAVRLVARLEARDPLADETHFGKLQAAGIAAGALGRHLVRSRQRNGAERRLPI